MSGVKEVNLPGEAAELWLTHWIIYRPHADTANPHTRTPTCLVSGLVSGAVFFISGLWAGLINPDEDFNIAVEMKVGPG